ncbi:NtaA/DmoA family FMN-dependent monooxygenase [Microbacteriaceae bacterium VKM Ac-2855]|nr:NtaA/DmoA family FMN-dependent monooxygenase [Microbacteriaceae bacterium VKM Ac-2855]
MFHMGWFLGTGFGVYGWNGPWTGNVSSDVGRPQLFIDMATSLERAGFDYMMLEDSSVLPDNHRGTFEASVKKGGHVRFDPLPLIPYITNATQHIGVIATISTTFYHPFMAARVMSSLDTVTKGRVGMNLVTSSNASAMQNYGISELIPHEERYLRANEWVDIVTRLWDSWDADAVIMDEATNTFADHTKVRPIDYEGTYYRSRGPLNTVPGPQGRPILCQAGGSPSGRDFGSRNADTIIAAARGAEEMKEYRDDVSRRAIAAGRDPKSIKVLFLVSPVIGETMADAEERDAAARRGFAENIDAQLAGFSYITSTDWSKYDIDAPFPDMSGNQGHQSTMADFARSGATIREAILNRRTQESVRLVGTAASVAQEMDEHMEYAGGDGYLIAMPVTRRNITEIADGLSPALRRRGAIRSSYDHSTFRENLLAY